LHFYSIVERADRVARELQKRKERLPEYGVGTEKNRGAVDVDIFAACEQESRRRARRSGVKESGEEAIISGK